MTWGAFKPVLADAVVAHIEPIQKRYNEVVADEAYLNKVHEMDPRWCLIGRLLSIVHVYLTSLNVQTTRKQGAGRRTRGRRRRGRTDA